MRIPLALCLVLSLSLNGGPDQSEPRPAAPPTAELNPNTTASGTLSNGTLTLALEAKRTMWYPEGSTKPGREITALSEASKPPLVPGPLVRVPAGTTVRLSIRNSLERDTIAFHVPFAARGAAAAD